MTREELTPDDVDELARRAQGGDRDALEQLLAAVRPRCLNICRGVLPYTPDAEDACQDALINLANTIGSWGRQGRFTSWMHVVAVNSARSTYRSLKRRSRPTGAQVRIPIRLRCRRSSTSRASRCTATR